MALQYYPENGPVMRAAKMALETGNANYILIWVPEESENTLKNLIEKTCCERSSRKNIQNLAINWYFQTVSRLKYANGWPHCPGMKSERSDEKPIVLMVERAIETGNIEEIIGVIPCTHAGDVRQRFHHVMDKRNYNVDNIADGRAYVSSFIDLIVYLNNLYTSISDEEGFV